MGLFGHKGGLSKIGHAFNHTLKHYDEILRNHGAPDMYVGATYGAEGFTPNINVSPNIGTNNQIYTEQPQRTRPQAYAANAAGTATSIKQGGMTKKEIQEFNAKHPNETAWRQS